MQPVSIPFARYDKDLILRCMHCGYRLGEALVFTMAKPNVRLWAQLDREITTRPPDNPTVIANLIALCPKCHNQSYIVQELIATASDYRLDRVQK